MSSIPLYLDTAMVIDAAEGEQAVSDAAQAVLRLRDRPSRAVAREPTLAACRAPRQGRATPDAVQPSTAIAAGCRLVLSQDLALRSIPAVIAMSGLDPAVARGLGGCLA